MISSKNKLSKYFVCVCMDVCKVLVANNSFSKKYCSNKEEDNLGVPYLSWSVWSQIEYRTNFSIFYTTQKNWNLFILKKSIILTTNNGKQCKHTKDLSNLKWEMIFLIPKFYMEHFFGVWKLFAIFTWVKIRKPLVSQSMVLVWY